VQIVCKNYANSLLFCDLMKNFRKDERFQYAEKICDF
jgi:hypothetical protein